MKTILVPTDFSSPAENAARYALYLAKRIKASIKLCNVFKVPAEAPMAAQVAWPLVDHVSMKMETIEELKHLANKLEREDIDVTEPYSYHPELSYCSDV